MIKLRRRRLEKRTDYKARLALLKFKKARLVARKTNKHIIVQIVETKQAQDRVITGLTSQVLLEKGWPKNGSGSLKNKAAAYLVGFLIGKIAQEKGVKSAIFDIGMHRNIHKSRLYAILKGAIDAGLDIQHSKEVLPSNEEIQKNEKFRNIIHKITKE